MKRGAGAASKGAEGGGSRHNAPRPLRCRRESRQPPESNAEYPHTNVCGYSAFYAGIYVRPGSRAKKGARGGDERGQRGRWGRRLAAHGSQWSRTPFWACVPLLTGPVPRFFPHSGRSASAPSPASFLEEKKQKTGGPLKGIRFTGLPMTCPPILVPVRELVEI